MSNRYQQDRDKLNAALADPLHYHSTLKHGADVLVEYLSRFKFKSLKEAMDWSKKPVEHNFDHIPDDKPLEILILCEKDTMAQVVAEHLSKNGRYQFKKHPVSHQAADHSFLKGYRFIRNMFGKDANVWITSTFGHLKEQTFPQEVGVDQTEAILYAKIIDVPTRKKEYYRELFAQFGVGCDMVILLLDNDEEGEAICFECIEDLMDHVNMPPSRFVMDAFYRARFSSAPDIVDAFQKLGRPNFQIYLSMIFKHHLDLRSGVALSRLQYFIAKHYLPDRYIHTLSFRPCGNICVKLDVDRNKEVVKALEKYCLEFTVDIKGKKIVFSSGEYFKEEAEKFCEKLKKIEHCEVSDDVIKSHPIVKKSPDGLNSFELLKFLSRYLFIDSTATAETAQKLYQMGLISYPRTETTKHSRDLNDDTDQLHENLSSLKLKNDCSLNINALNENIHIDVQRRNMNIDIKCLNIKIDIEKALEKGTDKLDHPPITPTHHWSFEDEKLNDLDKIVYNFIVRRYLATFMEGYSYCKESLQFRIGKNEFIYSYCTTVNPGFTQVLPERVKDGTIAESLLVNVGDKFTFNVEVKKCPPPPNLKEYQLIKSMEKFNIGTDGSIPKHIESIAKSKLIQIDNTTFELVPTPLGCLMTNAYRDCIDKLIEPQYRARFIQDVRDIASGKKDFVELYEENLQEISKNYEQLLHAFNAYFGIHESEFKSCYGKDYRYKNDQEKVKVEEKK